MGNSKKSKRDKKENLARAQIFDLAVPILVTIVAIVVALVAIVIVRRKRGHKKT